MNSDILKEIFSNYNIGLSCSVPERKYWEKSDTDLAIHEFVADFSSTIFKYGGRIVQCYHPVFTPIVMRQAEIHAKNRQKKPVTLVFSMYWQDTWEYKQLSDYKKLAIIIETTVKDTEHNSMILTRKAFIEKINSLIILGGKRDVTNDFLSDVGEELCFALKRELPIFAIGNTGGMVDGLLAEQKIKQAVFASNLMSEIQNNELINNDDVIFAAGDVLGHITRERAKLFEKVKNIKEINIDELCPIAKTVLQDLQLQPEVENRLLASVANLSWLAKVKFLEWLENGINNEKWNAQELFNILKDETLEIIKDGDIVVNIASQALKTGTILFDGLKNRNKMESYIIMLKQLDVSKNLKYDISNIAIEFALRDNKEKLESFNYHKEQMLNSNYTKESSIKCYVYFVLLNIFRLDSDKLSSIKELSLIEIINDLLYFNLSNLVNVNH